MKFGIDSCRGVPRALTLQFLVVSPSSYFSDYIDQSLWTVVYVLRIGTYLEVKLSILNDKR